MNQPGRSASRLIVGVALGAAAALLGLTVVFARRLDELGHDNLGQFDLDAAPFIATFVSATVVGAVLTLRRPEHPVGWLFLALGLSMVLSGAVEGYAAYGALARPDSLPAAELVAVVGDSIWLLWFALVALVLHLTPTGGYLSDRWRLIARITVAACALTGLAALLWPEPLEPPFDPVTSPLALPAAAQPVLELLRWTGASVAGLGLAASAVSLAVRFRRSDGTERRQLLWLVIAVVPLPAFVALAFWASRGDHPILLGVATGGFTCLVPVAAGLSIARYHLYDVERILSRAITYLLVSAILAFTFAVVVLAAGRAVGNRAGESFPAVLGTLAAVALVAPLYRGLQDSVDRRFDRRRYDALQRVRAFTRDPDPATDIEAVLGEAVHDPSLRAAYAVADGSWVTGAGSPVDPAPDEIEVARHGRLVARVGYDASAAPRELVESVVREATTELENAGLRAEIRRQLAEVTESRARLATAHVDERRRLERNLHDGAQQRLLALALQLRAAEVNGDPHRLRDAVGAGIEELQAAVLELRELANGLHPAALQGGLRAAFEELAGRFPVELDLDGYAATPSPEVEAAAWYIACEAVSNAVKHAHASRIVLALRAGDGALTVRVEDDGHGHARPGGSGLRGIADRAEAAGGSLHVESGAGGTVVTGVLPCGS